MHKQLRHHAVSHDKIGKRDIFDFEKFLHYPVGKFHPVGSIYHHLRRAYKRGLESGGAGCDHSRLRIFKKRVSRTERHLKSRILSHLPVEFLTHSRSCAHNILKFRETLCRRNHQREIVADLSPARPWKQSDNRTWIIKSLTLHEMFLWGDVTEAVGNLLYRRISHICHIIMMFLIETDLKRKNRIESVNIFFYFFYPPFLPSPDLW